MPHIETDNKEFIFGYHRKPTMKEQGFDKNVKICPHCGMGKQYLCGRHYSPCSICSKAQPYKKLIRIKSS